MSKVDDYIDAVASKEFIMIAVYISAPIIAYLGWQEYMIHILVLIGVYGIAIQDKMRLIDHAKLEGIDINKEIEKRV